MYDLFGNINVKNVLVTQKIPLHFCILAFNMFKDKLIENSVNKLLYSNILGFEWSSYLEEEVLPEIVLTCSFYIHSTFGAIYQKEKYP